NQYGKQLRALISQKFRFEHIINLENVEVFEESVIAYPAITTVQHASSPKKIPYHQVEDLSSLSTFSLAANPSKILNGNPESWFTRDYRINNKTVKLSSILGQGFKIGIGVATGRDKVFIGKNLKEEVEEEILLPMLTSRDVRGTEIRWDGTYFLNPYSPTGDLINLDQYPKAQAYLHKHYEQLMSRHVSKKNPSNWYRTIDKVRPQLTNSPKIILPDITGNSLIHIDRGDYYPHHNLYYITGKDIPDLELLAAVLMSDFIREQLSEIGNKMNGGYPRWQSQNLKKLQIPYLDSIPEETQKAIQEAYRSKDLSRINELICLSNFASYERTKGQLALFEPDTNEDYIAS
ncbi:MAG: hypothetical protein AAF399_26695, partial [Bacteroidota bacterium]